MITQPTIIFDLDRTLADTISDIVSAMNRTLAKYGIDQVSACEVSHLTGKGGLKSMISHAFRVNDTSLADELLNEIFAACVEDYRLNLIHETALYPDVRAALEKLRAEGWLLGVCTNKPVKQAEELLQGLGTYDLFAAITGADSFEFKKPDPRHLTQTIEIAGGNLARAIMVGDTQNDILTAQNAGIPVIAVDFGYSEKHVKDYKPDRVISSFSALFDEAAKLITCQTQGPLWSNAD
ncbi:Phosphoglycolate phosphatase [Pseudovibrio axinellae]|uniref:phosphoglycolate phosphatase n=1 Tax=Pseudovibrio axinellae TaxID=989403 RepID=A0A165Z038_9HYPH|nr:HAD-IA family hydrolase [Pseudovibrio axinellae]KZL19389.1 Phosphoglycolate phosphatase [Pseudovibrio axinellae]SEQ38416.1 phosphoglycolate phosphatase [Pseudovibrio axinellae]